MVLDTFNQDDTEGPSGQDPKEDPFRLPWTRRYFPQWDTFEEAGPCPVWVPDVCPPERTVFGIGDTRKNEKSEKEGENYYGQEQ